MHVRAATPAIDPATAAPDQFAAVHKGFKSIIRFAVPDRMPLDPPPANVFNLVAYKADPGNLAAYMTSDPHDGKRHPAIIWISGGDCNAVGEMWQPRSRSNDQTAAAFRKAGIVMMVPSLRGGNTNPGKAEGFAGEIDDVLAAADYLARQPYVDPERIYLGGHSTGGTLALLTAEASDRFRATFAYGPVVAAAAYRDGVFPIDLSNLGSMEQLIRTPAHWLPSVKRPVFILEGEKLPSNIESLRVMKRLSTNPNIQFLEVAGASHFSILAPTTEVIARKILRDEGDVMNIHLDEAELAASMH